MRYAMLLLISILALPSSFGVGYSATAVYGTIYVDDRFNVAVTAYDAETGERFPVDSDLVGNVYVAVVSKNDDGRLIRFKIQVNSREGAIIHEFISAPWDSHIIDFMVEDETFSARSTGSRGPVIDQFTLDSQGDLDEFIKTYDLNPPELSRPAIQATAAAISLDEPRLWATEDIDTSFFALTILILSLFSIVLLTKRHKNSRKNGETR